MKILITGADGLVASRVIEIWTQTVGAGLPRPYARNNAKLELLTPSLEYFNLLNCDQIVQYLKTYQPDLVIHFAAYTNVAEAEKQTGDKQGACWQINVEGTRNLIRAVGAELPRPYTQQKRMKRGVFPFIHISTDMVFPGSEENPGSYPEDQSLLVSKRRGGVTPPLLTWYGYTKLQAELLAKEAGATIVRILYPVRTHFHRPDYLRQPLQLFKQGKLYPLFNDQTVNFTFIDHLAEVLLKLLTTSYKLPATSYIFHVATTDLFTPYDLINYTLEKLGQDTAALKTASIKDFLQTQSNPHRYPVKGGLDVTQTQQLLKLKFPTWQQVVDTLISQGLTL